MSSKKRSVFLAGDDNYRSSEDEDYVEGATSNDSQPIVISEKSDKRKNPKKNKTNSIDTDNKSNNNNNNNNNKDKNNNRTTSVETSLFLNIPFEITVNIFSFLPRIPTLYRIRSVCKYFDQAVTTSSFLFTKVSLYYVDEKKINDDVLENISRLWSKELSSLNLSYTRFKAQTLLSISERCQNLEHLSINFCELKGAPFISKAIGNWKSLLSFSSEGIDNLAVPIVESLAESCGNLTHLNLSTCIQITNKSLINVAKNCTNLKSLNVSFTWVTIGGIHPFQAQITPSKLESLTFGSLVNEKRVRLFWGKGFPNLKKLILISPSELVSDLTALILCSPNLERLKVLSANPLTSWPLTPLPLLHTLFLAVPSIQNEDFNYITNNYSALRTLGFKGCKVDDQSISNIKKLSELTSLVFESSSVKRHHLKDIVKNCTLLQELKTMGCRSLPRDWRKDDNSILDLIRREINNNNNNNNNNRENENADEEEDEGDYFSDSDD